MPTYVVTAPAGRLSASQKEQLARRITDIHCAKTGAPAYFAQVLFTDVTPGNYFLGGKPLKDDNIFVHGQIRAGRGPEIKEPLILDLMKATAEIAQTHESHVQVYIVDVPARQIAEWGQLLPLPGEEAAWDAAVPDSVKQRMAALLS
ncbi:MAG: 4-oxalocrotonate tautomerase [Betaproteobacteria bacterium]|jgi:phenylpyruvate tautomerase PptA (4-oxalocrotonate tautomerase family)|nr:4-oxalocrotonate tautomerase [Betaproteobacteria bacterium]NBT11449.1 4-oxalocrotonate tautomerase [Betaproteobacteria bacterium]NBU50639.1 4-oxalocrotonate tautomerase [Betaproteobacteria bacterium]NBX95322.1 4-oxalocrotonate tautomerase [Betaproteobacteria bacterium]